MNKVKINLLVLFLSVIFLASCSSQIERDATEVAERAVEMEEMAKSMHDRSNLSGNRMTRQEFDMYSREYIEFCNKMLEKYSSREQHEEFTKLVNDKIEDLKQN